MDIRTIKNSLIYKQLSELLTRNTFKNYLITILNFFYVSSILPLKCDIDSHFHFKTTIKKVRYPIGIPSTPHTSRKEEEKKEPIISVHEKNQNVHHHRQNPRLITLRSSLIVGSHDGLSYTHLHYQTSTDGKRTMIFRMEVPRRRGLNHMLPDSL